MKYVRGYLIRNIGPFEAKEKFDGFVENVFEHDTHYVIQGIKIDKAQIEMVEDVSVKVESLDLPAITGAVKRKRVRKQKVKEEVRDEHDERFDAIKVKWTAVLEEAVRDAKRNKLVLPTLLLDKHERL